MNLRHDFGASLEVDVVRRKNNIVEKTTGLVATEVPFTMVANDIEIATLLCSPIWLKELCYGFLYTSGFIKSAGGITSFSLDTEKWVAHMELKKMPEVSHMQKRLYTSGCGKGVIYSSMYELAFRKPIENTMTIHWEKIVSLAKWLQHSSELYKTAGGIHTAAVSINGEKPVEAMDDVGRHNAVDKVIGKNLIENRDFSNMIMVSSGRTSSEILQKVRSCEIAITLSRGAPTHQTVLRARDMGITVIGYARGGNFTLYSHENRILFD